MIASIEFVLHPDAESCVLRLENKAKIGSGEQDRIKAFAAAQGMRQGAHCLEQLQC